MRATGFENVQPRESETIRASARVDSDDNGANEAVEAAGEWGGARETCDQGSTGSDEVASRLGAALHQWVTDCDRHGLMMKLESLIAELRVRPE